MKYYSVTEASKLINKSRQWVWVLIRMNKIKALQIGNQLVINQDEINRLLSVK